MSAFATITSKGQLTIPKSVRDELNLIPGDRLEFEVINGQASVKKAPSVADLLGTLKPAPEQESATVEDLDTAATKAWSQR